MPKQETGETATNTVENPDVLVVPKCVSWHRPPPTAWAPSLGILKMSPYCHAGGPPKRGKGKGKPQADQAFQEPEQQGRAQSIPDRPLISAALGDQWGETFRSQDASITWTWQAEPGRMAPWRLSILLSCPPKATAGGARQLTPLSSQPSQFITR